MNVLNKFLARFIDSNLLGLDPSPLCGADRTWYYYQVANRIIIIKSWRQKRHPANGNKQNCQLTRCLFDNWDPSKTTSAQKGGCGSLQMSLNFNDDDDDDYLILGNKAAFEKFLGSHCINM